MAYVPSPIGDSRRGLQSVSEIIPDVLARYGISLDEDRIDSVTPIVLHYGEQASYHTNSLIVS